MEDSETSTWLSKLAGSQLSSVTFVMDYLQLDFDGNRYTMYIWPEISINNQTYQVTNAEYRNMLCSLIAQVVEAVAYQEQAAIIISFKTGSRIILPINSDNPAIIGEIGFYEAIDGAWMAII